MSDANSSPSRIQILDKNTVNQIASGEVIENTSGIIRELLDNSIDAGASNIQIHVNFSDFMIEVLDDGCGIHPDDIALAFEKHSTSKIRFFEDIYMTPTLGFRGEALASLASVSEVTLETAVSEGGGVRYRVRGKENGKLEKIACNRGTRIQVRDLFFNLPVRKKFLALKSSDKVLELKPVEKKNIKQEIIRHILTQDGIGFQYFILEKGSDKEKLEINVPGHYTFKDKILMFFKSNTQSQPLEQALLPVHHSLNGFTMDGYITNPSIREYRSDKQFLIIKNRVVRDPGFLRAVFTGYIHKIPRGSHPMVFLRVKLDQSETVDINVHPRKEQVKFQNPQLFFDSILTAIRNALGKNLAENRMGGEVSYSISHPYHPSSTPSPLSENSPGGNPGNSTEMEGSLQDGTRIDLDYDLTEIDEKGDPRPTLFSDEFYNPPIYSGNQEAQTSDTPISVLGQVAETFIVFSIHEDLYVVDQHAAHERINYDRLLKEISQAQNQNGNGVDTQMLLIPLLLEKDPIEKENILMQQKLLEHLGFEVEPFGTDTLRINRVPIYLPEKKIQKTVQSLLDMISLRSSEQPITPGSVEAQEFIGDLVANMACRMSVMAGDRLSHTAMKGLVHEIYAKGYILTCPHGRPFVKKISLKEMKLFFDRGRHILGQIES